MSQKVFVSPGVYTSEKDLTFVTRQVGVTTLGLVGETTIGPAFQPIFISNYGEFQSFFGGLNNTLVKDTGSPLYELPYVAKSYLSQSNQLFVTRVLGLSGYDAGMAWGITLDAAMNEASVVEVSGGGDFPALISYSANTAGIVTNLTSSSSLIQSLIDSGEFTSSLAFLGNAPLASGGPITAKYNKVNGTFLGASMNLTVTSRTVNNGGDIVGVASGNTTHFYGQAFGDVENKLVALIRSRGSVNQVSQLTSFEVDTIDGLTFDESITDSINNPLGNFSLKGTSSLQGTFDYSVSLDRTKKNYLPKVLGRTAQDGRAAIFVEELYGNMFKDAVSSNKIRGIKQTMVNYNSEFSDYLNQFSAAVTPYIVSELRGNKILRLFRFHTISDGNAANEQFKISIVNIKPDAREFDIQVRAFYDTDNQPVVLESFSRCTMDPSSANYIGRRIGTTDGTYGSKSTFVLVECDDASDTSDAFPAGFTGYPVRDYQANDNDTVLAPSLMYKQSYSPFENKRKIYLGVSQAVGIDADFFDYKGVPLSANPNMWTGLTNGFHMDIDAGSVTIENGDRYNPIYKFDAGVGEFRTDADLFNGPYEKVYARKFTLVPFGGFDGWDVYNSRRTNTDKFIINGTGGSAGLLSGRFTNRVLSNGDLGINSDYYAYLEAIWTFKNPEAVNVNVFATPGIDNFENTNLVEAAIEMVEQDRADSLYIITTPDTANGEILSVGDVVDQLDGQIDSNYSCTYWPWVQINDVENNVFIYVPPTRDVVRNIALTDNIAFPWFAVAGIQRGDVDAVKARKKLTLAERDELYENRINPIATFTTDGVKIWGNKTLQVKETALNRISVRRLLIQARKLISAVSIRLLFEQNDSVVRSQFLSLVNPILDNIRSERGLTDFRVVLSSNPEDIDRNQLTGQIFLKPTRSLEFIQVEFVIMNTGASFDNI